ncbi:hypothetical protein MSPP1_001745 [Malassezia sp. CBS 17886]|nr:hypothetical protein MSPP1_001745 [Malassezia sp. CBS 17886]
MPLFVLSPASLVHSALFAGYYTYLSANVVVHRMRLSPATPAKEAKLNQAVRAHGNFAENVPFAFLLLFLAELNGAPTAWVHSAYTVLFLCRVAHGQGMQCGDGHNTARRIGFIGSALVLIGSAAYNFTLGYEPLLSFLGLQ